MEPGDFTTTGVIIILTVLVWIGWDVYVFVSKKDKTFSTVITRWSYYTPAIPFLLGFICGHWFW